MAQSLANLEKDQMFLNLVLDKTLIVDRDGTISNTKTKRTYKGRGSSGYRSISIPVDGKMRVMLAHRLVWLAFNGTIPQDQYVCFKDNNKSNIALSNLELRHYEKTLKENPVILKGSRNGCSKLTEKLVSNLRKNCKTFKHVKMVAKELNISHVSVYYALIGKTWKHVEQPPIKLSKTNNPGRKPKYAKSRQVIQECLAKRYHPYFIIQKLKKMGSKMNEKHIYRVIRQMKAAA